MKILYFIVLAIQVLAGSGEIRICVTSRSSGECKAIEAARDEIKCVPVVDTVECITKMQKEEVDVGVFSPEEALFASAFLGGSVDVVAEVRHESRMNDLYAFQTAVLVRGDYSGLSNLKVYCHAGFNREQYWTDQVLQAFEMKLLSDTKQLAGCSFDVSANEEHVLRLSKIFSKGCRPGEWSVNEASDKRLKMRYAALCAECKEPNTCSYVSPQDYPDSNAPIKCLTQGKGDVAYTALEFIQKYFNTQSEYINSSEYLYLCEDGTTKPLSAEEACTWVKQPWTSVLALRKVSTQVITDIKSWLPEDQKRRASWAENLKRVLTKEKGNLILLNSGIPLQDFVSRGRKLPSSGTRDCRRTVRWCTTSQNEKKKCEFIKIAALTHGILTDLECVAAVDKHDCLKKIQQDEADVVYISTELGYIARKVYNLTVASFLETERSFDYYGVVVVKRGKYGKFDQLKGARACFPQYNGLGWLSFAKTVKNLKLVPELLCSDSRAVWNFFSSVCAPGATDPTINPMRDIVDANPDNLCSGCGSLDKCKASKENPFFGELGALRCLKEDNGDVAFLDYNEIKRITDFLKLNATENNNVINVDEFEILCPNGSVANFKNLDVEKCSLTKINGGELVTRRNTTLARNIHLTFQELDDWFGTTTRHYDTVIKMYEPFDGEKAVLFKETTLALVSPRENENRFINEYTNLLKETQTKCYKDNGASNFAASIWLVSVSLIMILFTN